MKLPGRGILSLIVSPPSLMTKTFFSLNWREIFMKKMMDPLYQALGLFLPLITTNCAVLGVAILCVKADYSFLKMLIFSLSSGVGFALALVLFAGLRERFTISKIPRTLQGTAIGLVTAGLMSLAFLGFMGMA